MPVGREGGCLAVTAPDEKALLPVELALTKASGVSAPTGSFSSPGGSSNQPVELAARLARDRATIVDIGKCKLDLPWNDYYEKELDLRFSRSYGPGRYDPRYEVDGIDYPAGYVRWTERRNLHCFVDSVARKEIDPEPLIAGIFPLEDAPTVYEQLSTGVVAGRRLPLRVRGARGTRSWTVLLRGSRCGEWPKAESVRLRPSTSRVGVAAWGHSERHHRGRVHRCRELRVVHAAPSSREEAGNRFGQRRRRSARSQPSTLSANSTSVKLALTCEAILQGSLVSMRSSSSHGTARMPTSPAAHSRLEKPCLSRSHWRSQSGELERILTTVDETGNDKLMVGFNRRFSPILIQMRARFGQSAEPMSARYLVNAGRLGGGQLVPEQRGRRFSIRGGEGGQFVHTPICGSEVDPVEVVTMGCRRSR